jgi:hypothetical protein
VNRPYSEATAALIAERLPGAIATACPTLMDLEPYEWGFAAQLIADALAAAGLLLPEGAETSTEWRVPLDDSLARWGLTLDKFSDCTDDQPFAAVMTADGGTARLTYGDARAMLRGLLGAREQLDRIASWHSRETAEGGLVGDWCNECSHKHPCETRRMADGTHEDLDAGRLAVGDSKPTQDHDEETPR